MSTATVALLLKLTLAPALVAAATIATRRLGPQVGGRLTGIPVVAAPIELVYLVEHGPAFGRASATAAALGLTSLVCACVAAALSARHGPVVVTAPAAIVAFALCTSVLTVVAVTAPTAAVVSGAAIAAATVVLRRLRLPPAPARSTRDLLLVRLLLTAAAVFAVTTAAHGLSPHAAGLLAPTPIVTVVLATFTRSQIGPGATVAMLHAQVRALPSFLVFFVVLAVLLDRASTAVAFAAASLTALAVAATGGRVSA